MAHIIAGHASISRKDGVKISGYNNEGILFELYSGRVADPGDPENATNTKENNLEVSFP